MTDDLRLYKEQLARAERVAAWQDVARYVAHEIRNPLTPIKVSLHRLRSSLEDLDEGERSRFSESLDSILGEVNSLERLATSFSEFAKLPEPVLAPVDVNRILKELAELHQSESIKITLALDASLPLVSADAQQIRMAFTNVMKNAAEAMPEGGFLEVSSAPAPVRGARPLGRGAGVLVGAGGVFARGAEEPARKAGVPSRRAEVRFVEVRFKDTGCGIPQELIEKVTTPHVTTKKGGTGLGLAVVSKIISQHGGRVFVESRENEGTLVRMLLPIQLPT